MSTFMKCLWWIVLLVVVWITNCCQSVMADVRRVDGVNGSLTGDGSGWGSLAFKYLQDAIAASDDPTNEIWVANTTSYRPDQSADNQAGTNDPTATFLLPENTRLMGGFVGDETAAARDPLANETILTGQLTSVKAYHVVTSFQNTSGSIL